MRKSNYFLKLLFALLLWAFPILVLAATPPVPPQPSQHVLDLAGVMDSNDRDRLEAMLTDLEDNYRMPMVVLTLNSLDGEPIENFSLNSALTWGGEKKLKSNGVLITVAVKDKKYRIEVGYALQATLPERLVGRLGKQYLGSNLKKGDLSSAIFSTATIIVNQMTAGRNKTAEASTDDRNRKSVGLTERLTGIDSESIAKVSTVSGIPTWIIIAVLIILPVILTIWWYKRGCPLHPGGQYSLFDWLLWWHRNR